MPNISGFKTYVHCSVTKNQSKKAKFQACNYRSFDVESEIVISRVCDLRSLSLIVIVLSFS